MFNSQQKSSELSQPISSIFCPVNPILEQNTKFVNW